MDAKEYKRILAEHGRRVANRVAYEASNTHGQHGLGTFYAMYGSEDRLPGNERCKTGMIDRFDPDGFHRFYKIGSPPLIFGVPLEALTDHGRARLEAIVRMTPEERAADPEEFARNLTDHDVEEIRLGLAGKPAMRVAQYARHPDPGSPEAEAFLEANR